MIDGHQDLGSQDLGFSSPLLNPNQSSRFILVVGLTPSRRLPRVAKSLSSRVWINDCLRSCRSGSPRSTQRIASLIIYPIVSRRIWFLRVSSISLLHLLLPVHLIQPLKIAIDYSCLWFYFMKVMLVFVLFSIHWVGIKVKPSEFYTKKSNGGFTSPSKTFCSLILIHCNMEKSRFHLVFIGFQLYWMSLTNWVWTIWWNVDVVVWVMWRLVNCWQGRVILVVMIEFLFLSIRWGHFACGSRGFDFECSNVIVWRWEIFGAEVVVKRSLDLRLASSGLFNGLILADAWFASLGLLPQWRWWIVVMPYVFLFLFLFYFKASM